MTKSTKAILQVQGSSINVLSKENGDHISLTDMVRNFDGGSALIEQWLKNKDTVLFLGVWEQINNPGFNSLEFEGIRNEAGRNSFYLSAKKWIDLTQATGLIASAGRYGGTYAHKDIASEADLLNVALFGKTAKEWRDANPKAEGNIRDQASIEQLVVLTNLESLNSVLIRQGLSQSDRLQRLNEIAISQMTTLLASNTVKRLK
jgi:hypothetical protein